MATGKFVAYYRTSTQRQSLGIEAQKADVARFLNGGDWELIGKFEERESGKDHENRPQLAAAMAQCRKAKATLLIAKMDRLSRSVHFISGLLESHVNFVACDMPFADKTMIHVRAVFAEHERDMISKRTSDALQAKKAAGAILGNRTNYVEAAAQGRAVKTAKADAFAANVMPIVEKIRAQGATTLRAIAAELNSRNVHAPRGGEWNAKQVANVMARGA